LKKVKTPTQTIISIIQTICCIFTISLRKSIPNIVETNIVHHTIIGVHTEILTPFENTIKVNISAIHTKNQANIEYTNHFSVYTKLLVNQFLYKKKDIPIIIATNCNMIAQSNESIFPDAILIKKL